MSVKIHDAAIRAAIDERSPFLLEDGKTFVRHDEMRIRMQGKDRLAVEFYWLGEPVYTMQLLCDLTAGMLATITGVEGRMRLSTST